MCQINTNSCLDVFKDTTQCCPLMDRGLPSLKCFAFFITCLILPETPSNYRHTSHADVYYPKESSETKETASDTPNPS